MYYVVGIMLVLSFLAGSFILWVGIREFTRRVMSIPKMSRTQGTIIRIHQKYGRIVRGTARATSQPRNYPVIRFTTSSGAPVTFRSDTGDVGATRYEVGQLLPVLYDPAGYLKPLVDSWSGRWLAPLGTIVGGLLWAGSVGWFIYLLFFSEFRPPAFS